MRKFDEAILDKFEIDITVLDLEIIGLKNPRLTFRPAAILLTSKQDRSIINSDFIDSRELITTFDIQKHVEHVIKNYLPR